MLRSLSRSAVFGLLACFAALAASRPAGVGNASARNAAFGPFTLKVEIEGVTQGVFQAVEGLASESEVALRDDNGLPQAAPGLVKGSHLILKRPYDPLLSGLWNWRQAVIAGDVQKRDGHIFVFNADGTLVAHWMFHMGWPCRWEVPSLQAGSGEPATEVIEIVHQGLSLEPLLGS